MLKDRLIKSGAIKFGDFTLSNGSKSKYYIDIKSASLNPTILNDMILEIDRIIPYNFNTIVSIAVGGIPIATALSLYTKRNQVIIRKEKREHGVIAQIIGKVKDKKCIFIDDVATTGHSIMIGINAIRENGGNCNTAIVVVDRKEGAKELLEKNGVKLYSCIKGSELI